MVRRRFVVQPTKQKQNSNEVLGFPNPNTSSKDLETYALHSIVRRNSASDWTRPDGWYIIIAKYDNAGRRCSVRSNYEEIKIKSTALGDLTRADSSITASDSVVWVIVWSAGCFTKRLCTCGNTLRVIINACVMYTLCAYFYVHGVFLLSFQFDRVGRNTRTLTRVDKTSSYVTITGRACRCGLSWHIFFSLVPIWDHTGSLRKRQYEGCPDTKVHVVLMVNRKFTLKYTVFFALDHRWHVYAFFPVSAFRVFQDLFVVFGTSVFSK